MWNGRIGCPVSRASQTAPGCTDRAGPRGPSTVNAAGRPACMSRRSWARARRPSRDVDPRAVPYPNRSMMRAIHSPSKFALVITTMPRRRQKYVAARMRPCQKAKIGGWPACSRAP